MKTYHFYTISIYFSIICSLCCFFSCTSNPYEDKDHLVFRYNEYGNTSSLDPAFARNPQNIWPTNQIFNGLVQLDDSLQVQPDIAHTWYVSSDALSYTFHLRKDVKFHKHPQFNTPDSTRFVTAHDFVYSFDRLKDPNVASPGAWVLKNVKNYYAVNDSILAINLKRSFPAFIGLLSMRYCSVVPHEIVSFYGNDFRANPIGTGPFKFKRWEENVKLVLRKNEFYYEVDEKGKPLPYLEAVAITFLPDKQSEFLQFAQGNLDLLNSLDASYKDELLTPSGKLRDSYISKINISTGPYLNTEYLGLFMESKSKAIQSHKIRKAINYGFDKQKMITYLRNGIGSAAIHGFIPKGLPGFDYIKGYDYNPEKAARLVKEYIEETGDASPSISIGTDSNYLDICEYIQRELEKIGIKVEVNVMPSSTLRKSKSSGKLDIFRASWIADYPDAENYLSLYYSKNFTPNGPNYTHFKNDTFDTLYEQSLNITDINIRKGIYKKMDSILVAEAPVVPLYYDQVIRFTQKNVHGLTNNPQNFLVLKKVWKEKL